MNRYKKLYTQCLRLNKPHSKLVRRLSQNLTILSRTFALNKVFPTTLIISIHIPLEHSIKVTNVIIVNINSRIINQTTLKNFFNPIFSTTIIIYLV